MRGAGMPSQIDSYRVVGQLGAGGMGVVYEVVEAGLERRLALKLLTQLGTRDPMERARLSREAQALARLRHPHVVRVHAAKLEGPRPYLVQELLPGGSLRERLTERGPLSVDEAVSIVGKLAAGLEHAHQHGVLHRDLKPGNVLLDELGEPKLVDFGLAAVSGTSALTHTGAAMGTPAFMAPEQACGDRDLDARTDVYGLGALLFTLLTGAAPFAHIDGQASTLLAVANDPPRDPRELRPEIPAWLAALCVRCLAKQPADRPPSAAALRHALAAGPTPTSGALRFAPWLALVIGLAGVAAWLGAPAAAPATSPHPSPVGHGPVTSSTPSWDSAAVRRALAQDDPRAALAALGAQPTIADAEWASLAAAAHLLTGDTAPARRERGPLRSAARFEEARLALEADLRAGPLGRGWPPPDLDAELRHREPVSPAWLESCAALLARAERTSWPESIAEPLRRRLAATVARTIQACTPGALLGESELLDHRILAVCDALELSSLDLSLARVACARLRKQPLPELSPGPEWSHTQRVVWEVLRWDDDRRPLVRSPALAQPCPVDLPWLSTRFVENAHKLLSERLLYDAVERMSAGPVSPEVLSAAWELAVQAEFHGEQQWTASRSRSRAKHHVLDPDHSLRLVVAWLALGKTQLARDLLQKCDRYTLGRDRVRADLLLAECDLLEADSAAALERLAHMQMVDDAWQETCVDPYSARAAALHRLGRHREALAELARVPPGLVRSVLPWRSVAATRLELQGQGWPRLVAYARERRGE